MFIEFVKPIELPPYWLNHPEVVQSMSDNADMAEPQTMLGVPHACPLMVRGANESEWWQLPIEPVITISGKNIVVKRQVLKVGNTTPNLPPLQDEQGNDIGNPVRFGGWDKSRYDW